MPSMRQLTPVLVLLAALAVVPAAHARVVVVATGDGTATLTDVTTNKVVARIPVGGRARGAAVAPDGTRGYVATGRRVAAIDLGAHRVVANVNVPGGVTTLAASGDGQRLYVARRRAIDVVDAPTMTLKASIALGAKASGAALAVSSDATSAVVVLDAKHVGVVDLVRFRLSRRVTLAGATGMAFATTGPNAYVATRGRSGSRLVRLNTETGAVTSKVGLGKGLGGGVAVTTDGRHAVVGAARGSAVTAIVPLRGGKVLRLRTGKGPGAPAVSPDGTRIYVGDAGSGTVSVLSALSFKRLTMQRLGAKTKPVSVAVQPGVALITGTEGNDVLKGTRGMDRIDALGGDDQLTGGRDDDVLLGGAGNDQLSGGARDDVLDGGDGDDRMFGSAGNDQLLGGLGNDYGNGGTGNDKVDGGDGNDSLDGGDGDDTVLGGLGDDRIKELGLGNDFLLDGGPGNDFVDGNRGSDTIRGDVGNDTLFGGSGSEMVDGGDGDDALDGGTGGDRLYGRNGNDTIKGDYGNDTLFGSSGSEMIDGGEGDDSLDGGTGGDRLFGRNGNDTVCLLYTSDAADEL